MNRRMQRRMAMSRQMLNHPFQPGRVPVSRPQTKETTEKSLTDDEQQELLEHDVDRLRRRSKE